jgi:hypothetical protein
MVSLLTFLALIIIVIIVNGVTAQMNEADKLISRPSDHILDTKNSGIPPAANEPLSDLIKGKQ